MLESIIKQGEVLRTTEEKALRTLYSNINCVVTRDDLAQALWETVWHEKYSEYMIDTTIYRLRGKLFSPYHITTVRNKGHILTMESGSEEGRSWYKKHPHILNQEPVYRRFLLR